MHEGRRWLIVGTGILCTLAACKRTAAPPSPPQPPPTPIVIPATPAPSPTPTPVPMLPRKPADMARLFNGVTFRTKFDTPQSDKPASVERTTPDSYQVQITFTATLPQAVQTIEGLAEVDPKLPLVLNNMSRLVAGSRVSPYFSRLYQLKIDAIRSDLYNLDAVLSRHNFYDCETILELQSPDTGRKALLLIGDMDVNVDGSDGDRNVVIDDSGRFFQPQTSYRWIRQTERPNQTLGTFMKRLDTLKQEYAVPGLSSERNRDLREAIDRTNRIIGDLKRYSFLISSTDPSIVLPSFILNDKTGEYAPRVGDYAIVIFQGALYPAIVGDAGPSSKFGEASLRIARQINARASSLSRPVSNLKVGYLVFPGTTDTPAPPDLDLWRTMCKKYLDEIGGSAPELFTWENTVPPWPTPTPTPTPSPSPSASPDALLPEPSTSPSGTPDPSSSITPPTSSPSPAPEPTVITPPGTGAAS